MSVQAVESKPSGVSLFSGDRGFVRLALGASVVTFLMITIGAITRVTESGYGCGPYWPSCNGHLIPEFHDMTVVWEFGHRVFALIVGAFSLWVTLRAWRDYRRISRIFTPAMIGFLLFFVQSGLGAVTVALYRDAPDLQWLSVLLHLGNSMFLLACYLVVWVNARSLTAGDSVYGLSRGTSAMVIPPLELHLGTILSFMVAMVGAAVAGTNAAKACVGYPLCGGEVWPTAQGPLQLLNMLHRLIAGSLGLMLVLMAYQVITSRTGLHRVIRTALFTAGALYLAQAFLGALVVLVNDRDWLVVSRSLHVTFAAATWAAMVTASTVGWLQVSPNVVSKKQTPLTEARSATTSS